MDGFIAINKPPGISSHDVVNWARRIYRTRKVGHAGTLDPGASGVLVLGIGKGTRLISYLQDGFKQYRAELSLGYTTDTLDHFSPITQEANVPDLNEAAWQKILTSFVGESSQIPPMTSAIKIGGKKLYELARKGEVIERPARPITIKSCELVYFDPQNQKLIFDVKCSSGTYIRSLCSDIAFRAGTVGCMSFLLRTAVGSFTLANCSLLSDLPTQLHPLAKAVENWPQKQCNNQEIIDIRNGKTLQYVAAKNEAQVALFDEKGELFALAARQGQSDRFHPFKVFI